MRTSITFALAIAFVSGSLVAQESHCPSQSACPSANHNQPHYVKVANPIQEKDIVDTAVSAKGFSTLVAAAKAAGLVEALKGDGPFTVFAPTDEAFKKLPAGTVETLLKPENKDKLASILKFHVVSGKIMAGDVLKALEVDTLQGSKAKIGLTIGGANVIKADIKCSNGVIHVIDQVIQPASK